MRVAAIRPAQSGEALRGLGAEDAEGDGEDAGFPSV